jgi:hypothetical protein
MVVQPDGQKVEIGAQMGLEHVLGVKASPAARGHWWWNKRRSPACQLAFVEA